MQENFSLRFCDSDIVESLRIIHYGSDSFDRSKFCRIRNWGQKPLGGLWTCPINAAISWKEIATNDLSFSSEPFEKSFILGLSKGTRVAVIDSLLDLINLPKFRISEKDFDTLVDWEMVRNISDAVWLTAKGRKETRLTLPFDLTLWDCETVLVMNPDVCLQF